MLPIAVRLLPPALVVAILVMLATSCGGGGY
jgi:hypothetical protein